MSRVLSLALKITGDASGVRLTPVERALKKLGEETDKVGKVFDKFATDSEAGARAQTKFAEDSERLTAALKAGTINSREYADQFAKLAEAANKEAAALERAARITEANQTNFERFTRAQRELREQVEAGRISQETYNRALESAAKGLTDSERAAAGLAARVKETEGAAAGTTLKFNELSGVFAVLPGPLGAIAGRISGIASASEGLGRIFAGGLRTGIGNIVRSFTSLINPVTAALAAITAFGIAAASITSGLITLEDRVEKLGNTANKLGLSFQFVQVLDEAARRSGTSIDAVSSAFGRLQKSVLGIDEESKSAQRALSELGVTVDEIRQLNPEEQYQLIGQRLREIEDPARRVAAATTLFGRAGADLLPFFENITGAADDLGRFGKTLSEIQKRDLDQFGNSMDRLGVATRSASEQLLAEFAPAATRAADTAAVVAGAVARNAGAIAGFVARVSDFASGGAFTLLNQLTTAVSNSAQAARGASDSTASLRENLAALAQEFEKSNKGLDSSIQKAFEFGNAGFEAAQRFQNALKDLQEQALEEGFTAEQYARGVANATSEFEKQLEVIKQVEAENKKLADEEERREQAITQRVNDLLEKQLEKQEGITQTQKDLADIEEERLRISYEINQARVAGLNEQAEELAKSYDAVDRLRDEFLVLLDEELRGFDKGVTAAVDKAVQGFQRATENARKLGADGEQAAQRLSAALFAISTEARSSSLDKQDFDQRIADANAVFEKEVENIKRLRKIQEDISTQEEKFGERQFEIALERERELANVRTGSVKIQDIRSGGLSAFFDTLKEDPALTEAKKTNRELEQIRKGIDKLEAEKVDILRGAG